MKKFLSLALALVMTMSLVTVGAGAKTFTDNGKIAYDEAVAVASAAGIIHGHTDGACNPPGTLTRGAAAQIICNLVLGPPPRAVPPPPRRTPRAAPPRPPPRRPHILWPTCKKKKTRISPDLLLSNQEVSNYWMIFVTVPAPTVRPPSRMAKRIFSSRAHG